MRLRRWHAASGAVFVRLDHADAVARDRAADGDHGAREDAARGKGAFRPEALAGGEV